MRHPLLTIHGISGVSDEGKAQITTYLATCDVRMEELDIKPRHWSWKTSSDTIVYYIHFPPDSRPEATDLFIVLYKEMKEHGLSGTEDADTPRSEGSSDHETEGREEGG